MSPLTQPPEPAPDSVHREDLRAAMEVCAASSYEEGARIIARYREWCEQETRDQYDK